MDKTKRLRISQELRSYTADELNLSQEEIKKAFRLDELEASFISQFSDFRVEQEEEGGYYGSTYTRIKCYGCRDETDEEYNLRIKMEEGRKQTDEQRELEMLAKLKAKYENK